MELASLQIEKADGHAEEKDKWPFLNWWNRSELCFFYGDGEK